MDRKDKLTENITEFINLKEKIGYEQEETTRLKQYEQLQELKADILKDCSKNSILNLIILLIQNGLI